MSEQANPSDMTSDLYFYNLIKEICSDDARSSAGVNNINKIFQNNVRLFEERDNKEKFIHSFRKVEDRLNKIIRIFNDCFQMYDEINEKMANDFFEVLTSLFQEDCSKEDGNFSHSLEKVFKPYCQCPNANYKHHFLEKCWKISGKDDKKLEHGIINTIIECASDVFKNKIANVLQQFLNPDLRLSIGTLLLNHKYKLVELSDACGEFYENLAVLFEDKTYKTFTDVEKRNFHFCMVELISFFANGTDIESLKSIGSFLKDNLANLGIYYYVKIMHKLIMVGWYGVYEFHDEIKKIAFLETIWEYDVGEKLQMVRLYKEKLLYSHSVMNNDNRGEILNYLKEFCKYIQVKDYFVLIFILNNKGNSYDYEDDNDNDFYDYFDGNNGHKSDVFYETLKLIYDKALDF